ncbi:MAG: porphobilinogen synthase [Kiritimatiellae bacterium]|nr:porphobilinogen synthase [Kiritimatiellia bacterium]
MSNKIIYHHLHAEYGHDVLRSWQAEGNISKNQLVYPLFIAETPTAKEEITAMPNQFRWGVDRLEEALVPLVKKGLRSVLLFGVPTGKKDSQASFADAPDTPVIKGLQVLRKRFPDLLLITDICLCAYTNHGHCALLHENGLINNKASIQRLADIATAYAQAGAHVVAPSDMMDSRVGAIKMALLKHDLERTAIMSYSAKFASSFYGPFREAAQSAPSFGDRKAYQLPPSARKLALTAVDRDISEGANFVMVKPAGPYMDIIRDVKNRIHVPLACYQVSGEYAMLHHAARAGAIDLKTAVIECIIGLRRAGADIFITYYTPELLDWLKKYTE